MDKLTGAIAEAILDLYGVETTPIVTRTDPNHGDFSCNIAMQLAPKIGKKPREIAEEIVASLQNHELLTSAEVAGPGFINLRVKVSELVKYLLNSSLENYGHNDIGSGKTVVCEFPSPNMAKPFSVGHIRSALQGWAMYKLMQAMGYNVITDNHLGDSGTPFGKWVVGFLRYSSDDQLEKAGINELSRIYILITADMKKEAEDDKNEIDNEVQAWLKRLESGDQEAAAYSERFNKISQDHMHQVMQRLQISTEYELGESKFLARGQQMVDELLEKGIAEISDDAVIVRLDEYGIETPIMLRKANGSALYATTDLATVEYRQQTWNPGKVFIHTGQEQAFYFRQLKALAQKSGYKDNIVHLWHGLIDQKNEDGSREKMSSRKGVVLLNDLLDLSEEKAKTNMKDGGDEDIKAVALAAVKFIDFTADRKNGVLFDWDSMFSVHGFSGPAVQYAVVRIKSIINKSNQNNFAPDLSMEWQAEHQLLLQIIEYPELLRNIHDSYEMHKLATYLYELARELNRYYENAPILQADENIKNSRLWLVQIVGQVLESGLDILGIPSPEVM